MKTAHSLWTTDQWKARTGQFWLVKQTMQSLDRKGLWEYRLPAVGAPEATIREAEYRLGEQLHPEFRSFLLVAAGWPAFWHDVDILGPSDLLRGPLHDRAMENLAVVASEGLVDPEAVFPIAVSEDDLDLFVVGRATSPSYGTVTWFAGSEIDRYSGFQDFFLAMLEYAKCDLADFRAGMT